MRLEFLLVMGFVVFLILSMRYLHKINKKS